MTNKNNNKRTIPWRKGFELAKKSGGVFLMSYSLAIIMSAPSAVLRVNSVPMMWLIIVVEFGAILSIPRLLEMADKGKKVHLGSFLRVLASSIKRSFWFVTIALGVLVLITAILAISYGVNPSTTGMVYNPTVYSFVLMLPLMLFGYAAWLFGLENMKMLTAAKESVLLFFNGHWYYAGLIALLRWVVLQLSQLVTLTGDLIVIRSLLMAVVVFFSNCVTYYYYKRNIAKK